MLYATRSRKPALSLAPQCGDATRLQLHATLACMYEITYSLCTRQMARTNRGPKPDTASCNLTALRAASRRGSWLHVV